MAELTSTNLNLVDILKRLDPNGAPAKVAEILSKKNPILQDIPWIEGNLPTGHQFTSRTGLPGIGWRQFNGGIDAGKSETDQHTEVCGMLEGFSRVDCGLADLNGNAAAYRAGEDMAFTSNFGITLATALFYASINTSPDQIHGLSARLGVTAGNVASGQIIKADSSASGADQASIHLIGWGDDTVFGLYPRGQTAGLKSEDLGKQVVDAGSGKLLTMWTTHWKWLCGLCVKDWRYVVRACNIDTGRLVANASSGANLPQVLMDMIAALWDTEGVNPVFYMNRTLYSMLNKQLAENGTTNWLEYIVAGGRRIPAFYGIPIRITDALTSAESVVV